MLSNIYLPYDHILTHQLANHTAHTTQRHPINVIAIFERNALFYGAMVLAGRASFPQTLTCHDGHSDSHSYHLRAPRLVRFSSLAA